MAKQQSNDDNLFDNIDISGFEAALLEVDTPANETHDNESDEPGADDNKKDKSDGGASGKVKKSGKDPGSETKDNTIIVDTGPGDDSPGFDDDEKKAEKLEKGKKGGGAPDDTEVNESPVYLHAAALQEQGVLPNFDLNSLKDLEPEQAILKINEHIQSQIEGSIQDGIEDYKSTLGEPARKFIDSLEKGVPFDSLADNYTLEERYGSITSKKLEDDEELQEQVYSDLLALKGFAEPKIKKMVAMAKEKEELLEESTDGLKEIQVTIANDRKEILAQAESEKIAKEQKNKETREAIQSAVKSTKEIFPGIEINEEEKKDIIKMLTVPVMFQNKQGQKIPMSQTMAVRAKNPLAFEMRLAYFVKNGLFDEKPKDGAFDLFTKKVETSATKRLAAVMNDEQRTKGKTVTKADQEKKGSKSEKDDFVFPQDVYKR